MILSECEIAPTDLNGVYAKLAQIFDVETAMKFYEKFSGQQITYPMKLYDDAFIMEMIMKEYDGSNETLKKLAKRYGYTENWLRQKIKIYNHEIYG